MSQTMEGTPTATCPRCRSTTTEVRSTSPVKGVWTVFGCATCFYAWRSTEPEEHRNPDKYPVVFRLKPEAQVNLPVAPSIPQRRPPTGS
jgi:vanillate/4-hydroxybenzoate decarboxylase subunit D